jgi:hypothetical protein
MGITRRSLLLAALAAAVTVAAGCGPSSAQLKTAREARYQGTRDEVFLAVSEAVTKEKQIVDKSDPDQGALLTRGRWFEKDGTYEDKALGGEGVMAEDGSVFLAFLVRVAGDAPPYQVLVEPLADQIRSGYSAPYRFKAGDPELPGWIQGKVDDLQLALHARLKGQFIAPPGATAPTPAAP